MWRPEEIRWIIRFMSCRKVIYYQWEFQDPKMEVLYHIFCFPALIPPFWTCHACRFLICKVHTPIHSYIGPSDRFNIQDHWPIWQGKVTNLELCSPYSRTLPQLLDSLPRAPAAKQLLDLSSGRPKSTVRDYQLFSTLRGNQSRKLGKGITQVKARHGH